MAAVAVQRASALPHPTSRPIIERAPAPKAFEVVKFDPKKHLNYPQEAVTISMKDLGFPEDMGVSPVAVSQPFQLFTKEAVQQMRYEIFKPEVMQNHAFSSNLAASQLRGYAPKHAPFAYDAWNHPETLKIVSKIAGIELVPEMDYEIGHINFSVKTDQQTKEELATANKVAAQDEKPVVGWHTDSYPFVCVLMLSDCTNMIGGETALRTANGEILKVRGPQEGCAAILQGRYITHQALRALGAKERITSVTSFRPRSAFAKDDTVLTTVRPVSDLSELYNQYAEYRLEMMEERIRKQRKELETRRRAGKKFDTLDHKAFLEESIAFMTHTNTQIVRDSQVVPGYMDEMDIPDVVVGAEESPKGTKRPRVDSATI